MVMLEAVKALTKIDRAAKYIYNNGPCTARRVAKGINALSGPIGRMMSNDPRFVRVGQAKRIRPSGFEKVTVWDVDPDKVHDSDAFIARKV